MKKYKVLLDDYRSPEDVYYHTHDTVYLEQGWLVVRSFEEFSYNIRGYYHRGAFPSFVSLDCRIATLHLDGSPSDSMESYIEKTVEECVCWLAQFASENRLPLPELRMHSSNEEEQKRIAELLERHATSTK